MATIIGGVVQRGRLVEAQDREARALLAGLLARLRRLPQTPMTNDEEAALAYVAHGEPLRTGGSR